MEWVVYRDSFKWCENRTRADFTFEEHRKWLQNEISKLINKDSIQVKNFPFLTYEVKFPKELVSKIRNRKQVKNVCINADDFKVSFGGI